jgi:pimeloyl-ACP methyl ester carboxylesterase
MTRTDLLEGISSAIVETPRLKTHVLTRGTEGGKPVLFIHGNVSSARFWEETLLALPAGYRGLAVDLRGFGASETKPLAATRGLRDFSDDLASLIESLGLAKESQQLHLVGWSVGGGVAMQYAIDHPRQVASLALVAPMSPYGFGGTKDAEGTPCWPDYAGSGGGTANPEFVKRLSEGDRSDESNFSPRQVMNNFYFKPPFRVASDREEVFVSALLSTKTGPENYPGDLTVSANWPGIAPGSTGMNNAISAQYCNLKGFVEITAKPDVLWIRGDSDQIVSDTSLFDFGYLGQLGAIPGWPGEALYPPQPMIAQIRTLLESYQTQGGRYREVVLNGCGHSPHVEQPEAFQKLAFAFIEEH